MDTFMHILVGTWFVVSSNFPMWLKGDKTNPTFSYTLTEKKGKPVLLDEVRYMKNGRSRSIVGYDHPNPDNDHAFTWKGKGLLSIAKSNWQVVLINEKEGWAVIHFSKTLFTPEGVDIISRKKDISGEQLKKIKELMKQEAIVKQHASNLRNL